MADDSKPTDKERAEMMAQKNATNRTTQESKAYEDSKKPYVPEILKGVVRKASGGSIRGGGCETKGKTKGRMV